LSEYYASMFALIVQASLAASPQRFEEVIGCIRNVRDAWRQVAADPTVPPPAKQGAIAPRSQQLPLSPNESGSAASRWTA